MTDTTPLSERDQEQLREHAARAWDVWEGMTDELAILAIPDDLLNQRLGVLHEHLGRIWELTGAREPGLWNCDRCRKPIGAEEERIRDFVGIPDGPGYLDADGNQSRTVHKVMICIPCWEADGVEIEFLVPLGTDPYDYRDQAEARARQLGWPDPYSARTSFGHGNQVVVELVWKSDTDPAAVVAVLRDEFFVHSVCMTRYTGPGSTADELADE
jgi:hypothetical protein